MHVLNDKIRNNSVKKCARYIIVVPKWPTECPLEHAIQNSILIFPMYGPFCSSRHIYSYIYIYNFDKIHFLYAGGSPVSTLECLYDCILDMFLFCQNILNHIFLSCLIKLNPFKFSQEGINIEITQFIIFSVTFKI